MLNPSPTTKATRASACPGTCATPAQCPDAGLGTDCADPHAAFAGFPCAEEEATDEPRSKHFTSTRNACKLCTPLGASLAFRGVEGCIPFLHGSQGCATYIRRYLISHFREPIDIASSNFHEESAIFGGGANLTQGVLNVMRQYQPGLIGIATTCLAETIGENMPHLLHELKAQHASALSAPLVHVSTASYRGTHMDGFHSAVRELVNQLALKPDVEGAAAGQEPGPVALFPGMVSAADLRYLKEILAACNLPFTLLPDYSETLDGATWSQYEKLQSGGTSVAAIRALGTAAASIEFGRSLAGTGTAGTVLQQRFGIPRHLLGLPIGIRETDPFLDLLARLGGVALPEALKRERGRLVDSYIDGHKYAFERQAIVYGEEDLVIGLTSFLCEIGVRPVLCATGARNARFAEALRAAVPELPEETRIEPGFDFAEISEAASGLKPDFLLGSSKGYSIARRLGVPLVRVGFPIHDRIGGQRVLHLGYGGAQQLFDRIINALLETRQQSSPIGYSYL